MTGMEEMILWENPPDRIIQSKGPGKEAERKGQLFRG